eukprot:1183189-Prorocentrum_minimum.AAC.11
MRPVPLVISLHFTVYSLSPSAIGARYWYILSPSAIGARYGWGVCVDNITSFHGSSCANDRKDAPPVPLV